MAAAMDWESDLASLSIVDFEEAKLDGVIEGCFFGMWVDTLLHPIQTFCSNVAFHLNKTDKMLIVQNSGREGSYRQIYRRNEKGDYSHFCSPTLTIRILSQQCLGKTSLRSGPKDRTCICLGDNVSRHDLGLLASLVAYLTPSWHQDFPKNSHSNALPYAQSNA